MKKEKKVKCALTGAIILDGTLDMKEKSGLVILIENDRIREIIPDSEWMIRKDKDEYKIYDLSGKYIMPGLINMHVHLAGNGKPQKKQRDNEALVKKIMAFGLTRTIAYRLVAKFARLELLSGVTTIRTVGGLGDFDTKIRDDIKNGKKTGPRILAANQGISVPGGHMAGSVAIKANTIEEALAQVSHAKDVHTDLVKLMITGGVMDAKEKGVPGELKMKEGMVSAVCLKAHEEGYIVAAHTESPDGVKLALRCGVDSIEHGAEPDDEMMELFKKRKAFLTTTISPALPYALFDRSVSHASEVEQFNGNVVFEGIIDCSKKALENGIPVALGNDVGCPYISQYDFWRELVYFKKYCGVSASFALHTATQVNANLAGIGKECGTVEAGKCADLIVTEGNPLSDLRVLRQVKMVFSHGNVIIDPKYKRNKKVDFELDKYLN